MNNKKPGINSKCKKGVFFYFFALSDTMILVNSPKKSNAMMGAADPLHNHCKENLPTSKAISNHIEFITGRASKLTIELPSNQDRYYKIHRSRSGRIVWKMMGMHGHHHHYLHLNDGKDHATAPSDDIVTVIPSRDRGEKYPILLKILEKEDDMGSLPDRPKENSQPRSKHPEFIKALKPNIELPSNQDRYFKIHHSRDGRIVRKRMGMRGHRHHSLHLNDNKDHAMAPSDEIVTVIPSRDRGQKYPTLLKILERVQSH